MMTARCARRVSCSLLIPFPCPFVSLPPSAAGICRKDTLARNLRRMLKTWGSIYSYAPQTYILPRELKEFEAELSQQQNRAGDIVWICKPSSSSQGKNIFLITKLSELTYDCSFVVQRYIANPMLIGGYKYDLRMSLVALAFSGSSSAASSSSVPRTEPGTHRYCLLCAVQLCPRHLLSSTLRLHVPRRTRTLQLTEVRPAKAPRHPAAAGPPSDGSLYTLTHSIHVHRLLCRYDPSDMSNLFSHLTNASINKASPDLLTDKEVIGSGCKWTMARWFDYLESIGVNPYAVWERIKDIAILTLLPIVAEVPGNTRCFELFGFDIMLDETHKPWIIEVNASPAIAISGLQDTTVKIVSRHDTQWTVVDLDRS
jgi:hypothetical protein